MSAEILIAFFLIGRLIKYTNTLFDEPVKEPEIKEHCISFSGSPVYYKNIFQGRYIKSTLSRNAYEVLEIDFDAGINPEMIEEASRQKLLKGGNTEYEVEEINACEEYLNDLYDYMSNMN